MTASLALLILQKYDAYRANFMESCEQAKLRFEERKWDNDPATTASRLQLYDDYIDALSLAIAEHYPVMDSAYWKLIKTEYVMLLINYPFPEHARTFFNSIARYYFQNQWDLRDVYFDLNEDNQRFIDTRIATVSNDIKQTSTIFYQLDWEVSYLNIVEDTLLLQQEILGTSNVARNIEFYPELFYRNKKAYLLGSVKSDAERNDGYTIALKFGYEGSGVILEEVMIGEHKVKMAFEFTRSYFWVYTPDSVALVNYLLKIMPSKPREQMFINIGYIRHGKSVMYDGLIRRLEYAETQIVVAPGIRGLVMQVFTISDYHLVFKIIKDKSSPPKNVTKRHVKDRYRFVAHHDRVGRIADTQEFFNLIIKRSAFEPTLLADLIKHSSEEICLHDDDVIIRNVYLERKMVPLDIYIKNSEDRRSVDAIKDYGNAIKELAEANIFPGDLLIKNFGVTSEGRVIFYDYDEIVKVTDCNFRTFPEYDDDDDMDYYSAEPSYHVAPEDIFPQEFEKFLIPNGLLKDVFIKHHKELFTAQYWQALKERLVENE